MGKALLWDRVMVDEDGLRLPGGAKGDDTRPRDPDLLSGQSVILRRRDVDPVAVDRVVYGRCALLEVTPCDRVEAVSRLRRERPDWSHGDLARWCGCDAATVAIHDRTSDSFRYAWLTPRGARHGDP